MVESFLFGDSEIKNLVRQGCWAHAYRNAPMDWTKKQIEDEGRQLGEKVLRHGPKYCRRLISRTIEGNSVYGGNNKDLWQIHEEWQMAYVGG